MSTFTEEEAVAATAFPCQTPEQTQAVDPIHNLAFFLENHGKLGRVLVHEPEKRTEKADPSCWT